MMPGMNPRMMKQAMKQLGIQQIEIPATEVIIRTEDKDIVIQNPDVSKVNMMGQETYQVIGKAVERKREAEISEEDIKTVMEQANVDEDTARQALKKNNGDLAGAILELKAD